MEDRNENLPQIIADYIDAVVRRAGGKKVRLEVREELRCHFIDALAGIESVDVHEESARELIENFGDMTMLAKLIKRGKKRCRPLWQKVLLRSLCVLGVFVVLFVAYVVWILAGRPAPSIDYLARLNAMTKPAVTTGENAWPDYEKAIAAYMKPDEIDKGRGFTEPRGLDPVVEADQPDKERLTVILGRTVGKENYVPYAELKPEEQAAVNEWLARNEEAWGHYVQGSRKAYCYREYEVSDTEGHPMLLAVLLPHLGEMRDLARLGIWRSEKQIHEDKSEEAAETCLTVIRSGVHWQFHKAALVEQLVGQAMMRLGLEQIAAVVACGDLTADEMASAQRELGGLLKDGFPETGIEFERLAFEDIVQHAFTEGGPGGGHIAPKMLSELAQSPGGDGEMLVYIGAGLIHAGRNKTLRLGNTLYDRMAEVVQASPYELRTGELESAEAILEAHGKWRYSLLWTVIPVIERVGALRYQSKALYDATLTILAAKRWQLDKGELPESLEHLKAAGYLDALPADPYSAGPLKYARRDGDFLLYSFGEDFDDDGGTQDAEDVWGGRDRGGDRVFWPVQ